jgi:glycosyltransferase involved in cell wall biosynthesis
MTAPRNQELGDPTEAAATAKFLDDHPDPMPPVVVVIAALNEAPSIGAVIDELPTESCGLTVQVIVVDDGSNDGTAAVAREHGAQVCTLSVNRGQGAAFRVGYHLARARGARYIVTTDADGQYVGTELPLLLQPLIDDEADFVSGSRWLGSQETNDRVRKAGSRLFARMASVLSGEDITDTSFGFRAMRAELTGRVNLYQNQYQSSELLMGVLSRRYRVLEVPMTMRVRSAGVSKKGTNLLYGGRYFRVLFGTWWRERRGR